MPDEEADDPSVHAVVASSGDAAQHGAAEREEVDDEQLPRGTAAPERRDAENGEHANALTSARPMTPCQIGIIR